MMGTASSHFILQLKSCTVNRETHLIHPISRTVGRQLSISAFVFQNWRCIPVQEFDRNLRIDRDTKSSCCKETEVQPLVGIQSRRVFKLNTISVIFDTICNENYSTPGSSNHAQRKVRSDFW